MLPNVLTSNGSTHSPISYDEYETGQEWGTKLAEEFYHTISPNETDFIGVAKNVLHQIFPMKKLRTKSIIWFDEYYKAFRAYCVKKNEELRTQAAPSEKELQSHGQNLQFQENRELEHILNTLNASLAHSDGGEEFSWGFHLANPSGKSEE